MDTIEKLGKSIIQQGEHNDRIYLMKVDPHDMPHILEELEDRAKRNHYSKIFAKVPVTMKGEFLSKGYHIEAKVPNMMAGESEVLFMAKFYEGWRKVEENPEVKKIIQVAMDKKSNNIEKVQLPSGYVFRILDKKDSKDMTFVYSKVFETYPFPIHESTYLEKTMDENFIYFGIFQGQELIALSSCEMDEKDLNVEMTDFATLPEHRGKGLAMFLLFKMEEEMIKRGMITAFTIARALSYGMNITFAKRGYSYSGTLVKNTNISGQFETMNVWYKNIDFRMLK